MKYCYLILVLCFLNCKKSDRLEVNLVDQTTVINQEQDYSMTIEDRFDPPNGYTRTELTDNSFAAYLRKFKLKEKESLVYLFDGRLKSRQDVHAAVLDISVGKRDLQQCADAAMRLRAEYLYAQKQYDKISFNFTNGFKADYKSWRYGKRIKVRGNSVSWTNSGQAGVGRSSFNQYLTMVFSYAGTLSLAKEMIPVNISNIKIGDVFIRGGSPGHAVILVDMAENDQHEKVFLLAQSYMPAQEIHVLKNLEEPNFSPWYAAKELEKLITPEWTFTKDQLKKFRP